MRAFIRNINTGTHVIYGDKDGVTHNTSAHEKHNDLPVFTRDQNGVYR